LISEDEDIIRRIREMVLQLVERYHEVEDIEDLVDEVYDYAPFEFQRKYRRVRNLFYDLVKGKIRIEDTVDNVLVPLIDEALGQFPREEFRDLLTYSTSFREAIAIVLKEDSLELRLANELSEEFWFLFCYFLRLHPRCHENITIKTIKIWESQLPERIERYERIFGDILEEIDESSSLSGSDLLTSLLNRRKQEEEEELRIIQSFDDDLEGLGDFLKECRENYNR
jgi:hypothetical protein